MASAAASTPASSSTSTSSVDSSRDLMKQIWSYEVAIAELKSLPSSRVCKFTTAVYQKKGNIFFRTNIQEATSFEKRQLDAAKAEQQKLNNWTAP
ncbi:uncharacterized protein LOC127801830 isoform X1 [Diospyros lotus]|uniref:uncharacterized protein LOC127801830 isoform X1 n=1 Tax=Diospyros lotus TaxID=55363 RepID=UPI00225A5371|nr:uncharacterized protein LOC127801830 isoform X1 [Diospyros lotus]